MSLVSSQLRVDLSLAPESLGCRYICTFQLDGNAGKYCNLAADIISGNILYTHCIFRRFTSSAEYGWKHAIKETWKNALQVPARDPARSSLRPPRGISLGVYTVSTFYKGRLDGGLVAKGYNRSCLHSPAYKRGLSWECYENLSRKGTCRDRRGFVV